jgi:hypothetical protein
MNLILTNNQFDIQGYWTNPIHSINPTKNDLALFDQNGYDLTDLEKHYARINLTEISSHRSHRTAVKQDWFIQEDSIEDCVLNHSCIFERKGYSGAAREQLLSWANDLPLLHQLLSLRPKWGLDFSMDYVDRQGNAFEVLHWEYDGFDFEEIQETKIHQEQILADIDWNDAAKSILSRKNEWHHLDFFAQSDWKCDYFGITHEKFKMVAWQ